MLEIKNLHARIGDREILKGLTLTVKPGEVHAIMGPNGAGKSTLSYILAGKDDYEVTEGEVLLNGASILDLEPNETLGGGPVPRLPVSDRDPRRRHHDIPQGGAQFAIARRRGRAS